MKEIDPKPVCAYDDSIMRFYRQIDSDSGKGSTIFQCTLCPNSVTLTKGEFCPVCFSNYIVFNGDVICSNSDCAGYHAFGMRIVDGKSGFEVYYCPNSKRKVLLGRFISRVDSPWLSSDIWLAPSIICAIAVHVVEKHIAIYDPGRKVRKPGVQYARD